MDSTTFTLNTNAQVNGSGESYVAYIFAHNDGDGEFGPDGDQDIIKCGSYTGNDTSQEIDVGFEPQWLMIKSSSRDSDWLIVDSMRNWMTSKLGSGDSSILEANTSDAESAYTRIHPSANGFGFDQEAGSWANQSGHTYIYIAIRRGTKVPESATEVFNIDVRDDTDAPMYKSGFVTDFSLYRDKAGNDDWRAQSRLTGKFTLFPNTTAAESSIYNSTTWDFMNGFHEAGSINTGYLSWMWKRAPGYFDAVAYTGNGTAGRTVSHNLGVAPEMMWVKSRANIEDWSVYHAGITNPEQNYLYLNSNLAVNANSNTIRYWNHTNPTDSVFTLGDETRVNGSAYTYIAYLFASLDGVSKVGSYTGTGSTDITIDCGFTAGARFVLIKRTNSSGNWWIADTSRGIVSGNESLLALDSTAAQQTAYSMVEPSSSGFIVNGGAGSDNSWNGSGDSYIFYAIA